MFQAQAPARRRYEPQCLYRFYDTNERLLYIGITNSLPHRLGQHNETKPWWLDVSQVVIEHYNDRQAVLDAERDAIIREEPLYNIQHAVYKRSYRIRRRPPKIPARHILKPSTVRRLKWSAVKLAFAGISILTAYEYLRIHF